MATPVAVTATRRADQAPPLRALVLLGVGGLLVCALLRDLRIGNGQAFWSQLTHPNVFMLAAFGVALWRAGRSLTGAAAGTADFGLLTLIALAAVPLAAESSQAGLGLCLGATGVWIMLRDRSDPDMRAAAICLLALCANFSIAPLIFRLAYHALIGVDMALLEFAIGLSGAPMTVTPTGLVASDGMRVMLVGACSSFKGVSTAVLVHMTWAMAIRTEVSWRDSVAVAATVCLATLLNVVRLTLTASGAESHAFWHGAAGETPLGGEIVWFAHHAILLTGGYLSAHWAGRPDAASVRQP